MHELSLAGAIVDTVERHADGRRVEIVNLRIGQLRQVVPDSLDFYFGIVAHDTVCDGARLAIELVAGKLECSGCGTDFELDGLSFRCPGCGSAEVAVVSGNEFEVDSIELAELVEINEEATCIAPR